MEVFTALQLEGPCEKGPRVAPRAENDLQSPASKKMLFESYNHNEMNSVSKNDLRADFSQETPEETSACLTP